MNDRSACELEIEISASTDQATVVNVSNHVYFNLAGHGSGWAGLQQHTLRLAATHFTPDDEEYLPTGADTVLLSAVVSSIQ